MMRRNLASIPTTTTLITELLRERDDFMTARQLQTELCRESNRVSAALIHLRQYRVVDCLSSGGELWWFALPEEQDARIRVIHEFTPHHKHRPEKAR